MHKHTCLRLIALTCALALMLAGLALAEAGEVAADPIELAIDEQDLLLPAPEDIDGVGEVPLLAPEDAEPEPVPDAPAEPVEEPEDGVEGYVTLRVDAPMDLNKATLEDVNLVRAEGYTGPLGYVTGKTHLNNVLIEGQPAAQAKLLDYFQLAPKASIVCGDDCPLAIHLNAYSINNYVQKKLNLTWKGKALKPEKAKWKSSDKKIVTVSKSGLITAQKKGAATVTATFRDYKVYCRLEVTSIVYPKSISLNKTGMTLSLNHTAKLKATISPKKVDDPTVTWTSSKPEVASVDDQGNVAALATGKAKITATTVNGKTAACTVTVKRILPNRVGFKTLYVTMHPGESFATALNLKPADVSEPEMTYTSDDPSVASVDEAGVITANGCGTATVTVTSVVAPKVKNTCKVCVLEPGSPRLAGLVIGINPGHQIKTISRGYPLAPGSTRTGKGVKTGAVGNYTRIPEYETVLQIGLKLKRILEEQGATVVITRTSNDVMLTNIDRAKMLNAANVDVALQLHCNSVNLSERNGVSAYIRTTGDWVAESRAIGKQLIAGISKASGLKKLEVYTYNDYMSLNWSTTPAVLLEMGYLSNYHDDVLLSKNKNREAIAQGICNGLCAYFGR